MQNSFSIVIDKGLQPRYF